jgi:hypothetical protein
MQKPIDRWLGLFALFLGIAMFWIPKTPFCLITSLVLMFAVLIHPIWNFWWIEKSLCRRFVAILLFVLCLCAFGYAVYPEDKNKEIKPPSPTSPLPKIPPNTPVATSVKQPTAEEIAREITKNNMLAQTEQQQKENARRKRIRENLGNYIDDGNKILRHCEGRNLDGTPLSTQVDPWAEFADWNVKVSTYLGEVFDSSYHIRKENVEGMFIPVPASVLPQHIHTYQQVKGRITKLDEFIKELKDLP